MSGLTINLKDKRELKQLAKEVYNMSETTRYERPLAKGVLDLFEILERAEFQVDDMSCKVEDIMKLINKENIEAP